MKTPPPSQLSFKQEGGGNIQKIAQTKGGYYLDSELFIGGKALEADILYRNYGDNIVTSFGWTRSQPFTAVTPAGPKYQAYTISMKNNIGGEKVFLFFKNEQHYSHFYNYILGK